MTDLAAYREDQPRSSGRFAPKHGMNGTPEYRSWQSMKSRCLNPNFTGYPNYGGRGIQICDRWMSFANFFDDMGARPSLRYSLDRIDTDGHYEPANCRWATREQQNRNQRKTVITPELLTEIRQSPENSHRLAKRLGLTMSIVYRIRAGESWYAESGE